MKIPRKNDAYGFTIVELLIVVVVIAILAAITIVTFNGVQMRARDSARRQDLGVLAKAIKLYSVDVGDHAQAGCGSSGTGTGWLHSDYDGTGPLVSINDCLMGNGPVSSQNYLGKPRIDPSGKQSCAGLTCTAYMKASCASGTWVMAHLETLPQVGTETDGTCQPAYDTNYGINYVVKVD